MSDREILLECSVVGGALRVAAVDPVSLVEVVFQVPVGTSLADIERLARARLAHRLRAPPSKRPLRSDEIVA